MDYLIRISPVAPAPEWPGPAVCRKQTGTAQFLTNVRVSFAWVYCMDMAVETVPMSASGKVNIRPGVSVLSVLRHLKYSPWFALAEFVDNSVQSYFENKSKLHELHGPAGH